VRLDLLDDLCCRRVLVVGSMLQSLAPAAASTNAAREAETIHVRIRNLSKRFRAFTALSNISLDVRNGELVCFLGPSGCGKTTLLRAIAGLDRQDEGLIELGGRDVSNLPPAARDFGIVFQSYALFPNLSIRDNVGYGLVNRQMPKADIATRVRELLALVDLADQGDKYPAQLSGGQQQRVALARALATAPSLLLLDEPLSALDARVRVRLRDEIKSLQRRLGVTTIMVTHDQEEALAMADRIVVMNHGTIEQIGTPREIYSEPTSAFVADFVGTMTFINGVVGGDGWGTAYGQHFVVPGIVGQAAGTTVRLGFRPEEIQVRNIDDTTVNQLTCTVTTLDYLGSFCRATLAPISAPGMTLTGDFSVNLMRDIAIVEGQMLAVALPPHVLRVFPASTPTSAGAGT
jgi:iron(III) transport system ATP-binding protein